MNATGEHGAAPSAVTEPELLCCVSVPRQLEDRLIDWLLARGDVAAMTSAASFGHGVDKSRLTIAEEVGGKQRRLQVQIRMPAARLEAFTAALAEEFGAADLDWWAVPLAARGTLRRD